MTYRNYREAYIAMEDTIGRDRAALGEMSIAERRTALDARLNAAMTDLGFTESEKRWFRTRAESRRGGARPWAYETACVEAMIAVAPEALRLRRAGESTSVLLDSGGRSAEEIAADLRYAEGIAHVSAVPSHHQREPNITGKEAGMTTNLNPADVQAGVRSAVREWLDANGADIAELIARTVAETLVHKTPAVAKSTARIEEVAETVHEVLARSASGVKEGSLANQLARTKRPTSVTLFTTLRTPDARNATAGRGAPRPPLLHDQRQW